MDTGKMRRWRESKVSCSIQGRMLNEDTEGVRRGGDPGGKETFYERSRRFLNEWKRVRKAKVSRRIRFHGA